MLSDLIYLTLCVTIYGSPYTVPKDPLSDEFIAHINQVATTWKAGRNFHHDVPFSHIRRLMGTRLEKNKLLVKSPVNETRMKLPTEFDSRKMWKHCPTISEITDQGDCGSCWAHGSVEAMSDRICIHSGGKLKTRLSIFDVLTCCFNCGQGCHGGFPEAAYDYWETFGIVSGGSYGSHKGCRSYGIEPCEHFINGTRHKCVENYPATPKCVRKCDNDKIFYKQDLSFGKDSKMVSNPLVAEELFKNGPVTASFFVYEDFIHYKSGVYQHTVGDMLGAHAVRIIGWGVEKSVPYWLVANSWNTDWGDNGFFKILRGHGEYGECGIENYVLSGLPKLV